MTIDEIKLKIKESGKSVVNVKITTNGEKSYKQSLRINNINQLCIGVYKSTFPNYIINSNTIENWKEIKILK